MEVFEQALERLRNGEQFALVTVVARAGSVPAVIGSRMIIYPAGTAGTVGGGALEHRATALAREALADDGPGQLVELAAAELGMHCGGTVSLFIEPYRAATALWVFGGGHIGRELVPLAAAVGFRVAVVDNRAEFATADRFPAAAVVHHAEYDAVVDEVPDGAYAVIVTHMHAYDGAVLRALASREPALPYVGMIGSRRKVADAFAALDAAGVAAGDNVYAPVGLDLGGGSPTEIAVSIIAEILGVAHRKEALPHCRDRVPRR